MDDLVENEWKDILSLIDQKFPNLEIRIVDTKEIVADYKKQKKKENVICNRSIILFLLLITAYYSNTLYSYTPEGVKRSSVKTVGVLTNQAVYPMMYRNGYNFVVRSLKKVISIFL